jgi:phosphatidate cytidylyltransferase
MTMAGMADGASKQSNLVLRIASAMVLGPLAIGVAYLGGWPFAVFWGSAAVAIAWEWTRLVDPPHGRGAFIIGAGAIVIVAVLGYAGRDAPALIAAAVGVLGAAYHARGGRPVWTGAGVAYASALLIGVTALRKDLDYGLLAIYVLFAIVWGTDILGYFVGRAVGGPKLAPAISPNKTWSGAVAGSAFVMVLGAWSASAAGIGNPWAIAIVALLLSIAGQSGDLFESSIERRFHVKDASALIPGHGGVMDRLDGFWAATVAAAVLGALRGGLDAPARGLLLW